MVVEFGFEFGNADVDTLEAMSDLVYAYHAACDQEKAEALARRLLVLQKATFLGVALLTLATESMIARILHSRGRYLEDAELRRQILERRQKEARLGNLTAVAGAAAAYGQPLLRLERYSEAENVLRIALDSYECPYDGAEGDRHLDILDCKESLADTLSAQWSHEKAVKLGREVLEGRTRSMGLFHAETINGMSNLATYLCRANQSEESRVLLHNAMGISAVYLGREHSAGRPGHRQSASLPFLPNEREGKDNPSSGHTVDHDRVLLGTWTRREVLERERPRHSVHSLHRTIIRMESPPGAAQSL